MEIAVPPNLEMAAPSRQHPPLQPALAKGGWRRSRRGDSGCSQHREKHPPPGSIHLRITPLYFPPTNMIQSIQPFTKDVMKMSEIFP